MRIRSVKPDFWRDRDTTGRWPIDMKLIYVGLWCVADDEGRLEFDPDLLAADLDPFRTFPDLMGVLERIRQTGCLVTYQLQGQTFGFLPNFKKHQKPNKPSPSRLPAPPRSLLSGSRSAPVALPPGEEGRGEEKESSGGASQQTPAAGPLEAGTHPTPQPETGGASWLPPAPVLADGDTGAGPSRFPKAVAFRVALSQRMCRMPLYPVGGREAETWPSLEASLEIVPLEDAVDLCQERVLESIAASKGRQPGNLGYFAQVLADEAMRRRAAPPAVPPQPVDVPRAGVVYET